MLPDYRKSHKSCYRGRARGLCGGVDEAEDVVEDVPALALLPELEGLSERHGLVRALDLVLR
jgi:hypothetical protein